MRQRRRLATAMSVCALLAPARANAQDTIEGLVAAALERSPDLRAARASVTVSDAQVTQAGLRPNPTLMASQLQMTGAQHQTVVGLEWPLELFRRPPRLAVARHEANATARGVEDQERLLAARVREQAGRLLASRRLVDVMAEALGASRRMRELLDQKVSEGDIPRLDANIAAVEVGRMEVDLTLAQADADAAVIELRALVGLPADVALQLRDSLEALVRTAQTPPVPAAAGAPPALEGRPDLREAAARVAAADASIEAARAAGRFDMTLSGSYGHEFFGFAQRGINDRGALAPIEGSFNSVTFGAALALPFRNRNQGALAAAQATRTGAEETLAARQLVARSELDAAVVRDREARRAVELYATNIREQARQNVDVELEAYDLGRTSLSDVLTEQRRYLDVEAAYTTVLQRAYDAQVALRRARGDVR